MASDFEAAFVQLKGVFEKHLCRLAVKQDTALVYDLAARTPSPLPQHKGHPMWFGAVRRGKAYVSFHLMPLYMNPPLLRAVKPALRKHMQGKTCFGFKGAPAPALLENLEQLVEAGINDWAQKKYL